MAEMAVTAEVQIDAEARDVFKWVIEPQNMVLWVKGAKNAGWTRRQEVDIPRPGDSWCMVYEFGGKDNEVVMEVDVCDSRTGEFEYHTIEGPYPIRSEYLCQSVGKTTLLRVNRTALSEGMFTSIMFALTGFISKPMMRKGLQAELEKLKPVVESQLAEDDNYRIG